MTAPPAAPEAAAGGGPARAGDPAALAAECRIFTRHLIGAEPDDYIVSCYIAGHEHRPGLAAKGPDDRALLALARTGAAGARLADAHGRIFLPGSALRRKLILLLAILETSPLHARRIDHPGPGPAWLAPLRLGLAGLAGLGALALGTVLLVPWRLAARASGRRAGNGET